MSGNKAVQNPSKLYILGTETGEKYTLQINPEGYDADYKIDYDDSSGTGKNGSSLRYFKTQPSELKLKFTLDGTNSTGLSPDGSTGSQSSHAIKESLAEFFKVCMEVKQELHRPQIVEVFWGELDFKGVLTNAKVNYTYFDSQGNAIRAEVDATFKYHVEEKESAQEGNVLSPDLTRVHIVQKGDKLPQLAFDYYGDSKYYLPVAEVNGLNNYRQLIPGQELFFPPLDGGVLNS